MGAADTAIAIRHLDFAYGQGESAKQILFDISLDIKKGSMTALLGASGSGKTTLITLIGGLRRLQQGHISVLGQELAGATEHDLMLHRRRLGFIFQAHNLHDSLTALQNVRLALEVHGPAAMARWQEAATHALGLVGLSDRCDYLPARLSGGQKQRVAVARALVANPQVVLADEPTAALDKENGIKVVQILKRLGELRGTTTILVTHDNRILDMADRIIRLDEGRVVEG